MIDKLKIQNFQSHKKSILKFDPGVNVIIGETDSGKSAIIRALRLGIKNKPNGDAFRSKWGGDTSVSITTSEGDTVIRSKGSKNLYQVNDHKLTAFGTDVPDAVKDVLNIEQVNAQFNQRDAAFLLQNTAGEVAQYFNKIAHLHKIDKGEKYIKKQLRSINTKIENNHDTISSDKKKLKKYDNIEELEILVEQAEQTEIKLTSLYNQQQKLNTNKARLALLEQKLNKLRKWKEIEHIVNKTIDLASTIDKQKTDKKKLANAILNLKNTEQSLAGLKTLIRLKTDVDTCLSKINQIQQSKKDASNLSQIIVRYKKINKDILKKQLKVENEEFVKKALFTLKEIDKKEIVLDKIQDYKTNLVKIENKIKIKRKRLKELEQKFHDNFPDICPLCGK